MFVLTELLIERIKVKKLREIEQLRGRINDMLLHYPPPRGVCELIEDCETCVERPLCTWCSETQRCHEGNHEDGVFFWPCRFMLVGTCEAPRSELWFDMKPEPEPHGPLDDFLQQPDMPLAQKQFLVRKQHDMLELKNAIDRKRLQLRQMHNLTVSIRAKRIALVFEMRRIEALREQGIIDLEGDSDEDYDEAFLDVVDIDEGEVGQAILRLEEEVREMQEEDVEIERERQEEQAAREEEELAAKRAKYENSAKTREREREGPEVAAAPRPSRRQPKADAIDQKDYKPNEPLGAVFQKEDKRK